ncbi:MAG: hypothetical protein N3G75_06795 [Methanothrix sp.]|nr:hypothetical protein [Methanothrix sp.]MCX8207524.1 hypothetical protein [Methanothrix sp.]
MTNLRDAIYDTIRRELNTLLRIEIGQVENVYWHKTDGDYDYNVVDVRIRDYRAGHSKELIRRRIPVLQREGGRWQGTPWTPKIGDLVVVLFYQNEKAVVLGTLPNWEQPPLCRPGARGFDDDVRKLAQWQQPSKDGLGQYIVFPPPRKPYCEKWWGKDRSRIFVLECPLGDSDPTCQTCDDIDKISDCSKSIKIYSSEHEEHPDRVRINHNTGSFIQFERDGSILIKNATSCSSPQGRIRFHPSGTIEIVSEEGDSAGSIITVYSDDDGDIACEMRHRPTGALVRIYKSGQILLRGDTIVDGNITVTGSGSVVGAFTHGDGPCCGEMSRR